MAQTDRILGIGGGVAIKPPCVVATTGANITTSSTQVIDGIAVSTGNRVLVKDQDTVSENGIYIVASGTWTRAPDFDGSDDVVWGTMALATTGASQGGKIFQVTSTGDNIPGTDNITFAENTTLTVSTAVTVTTFAETFLDDSSAVDVRTTLGLVIGDTSTSGDVQAYDAQLSDLAGIAPSTGGLLYFNTGSTLTILAKGSTTQFFRQGSSLPEWGGFLTDDLPNGSVLQVVSNSTSGVRSTEAPPFAHFGAINSSDGFEFTDLATSITPNSTSNKLRVQAAVALSKDANTSIMAALFNDATAGALATSAVYQSAENIPEHVILERYIDADTTSATTFKVRIGSSSSGDTITINGRGSTATFGGSVYSWMTITEVKA